MPDSTLLAWPELGSLLKLLHGPGQDEAPIGLLLLHDTRGLQVRCQHRRVNFGGAFGPVLCGHLLPPDLEQSETATHLADILLELWEAHRPIFIVVNCGQYIAHVAIAGRESQVLKHGFNLHRRQEVLPRRHEQPEGRRQRLLLLLDALLEPRELVLGLLVVALPNGVLTSLHPRVQVVRGLRQEGIPFLHFLQRLHHRVAREPPRELRRAEPPLRGLGLVALGEHLGGGIPLDQ
mmetsp:Transcript_68196/g.171817  ORF Transcript_68196/g.171817 Transcript_68196/m.171817 type:complete len:235 (-) Transcript_68196:105-809(-)